jgi:hypothetical protein
LIAQRVYGLACGYPDANDAARLSDDPIHKLLLDRDPIRGARLASQPTLSRFENAPSRGELLLLSEALFETVFERHAHRLRGRLRHVTVDLDVTDDPTHGAQQFSFLNGHYGHACYLPMLAHLTFNDEPEQYLCAAVLRPGNALTRRGTVALLTHILRPLQGRFPGVRLLVRLDGGYTEPELFEFLDEVCVDYVVRMPKNAVLERHAALAIVEARQLATERDETAHLYAQCRYAAKTWERERRVVIKAEVTMHPGRDSKDNPRFVVTNLTRSPQRVYERVYCARGELGNRLKELHHGLAIDRTSRSRFLRQPVARALDRGRLRAAAGAAAHGRRTCWARAQIATLREQVLNLDVQVVVPVRRLVLHLPAAFPFRDDWRRLARARCPRRIAPARFASIPTLHVVSGSFPGGALPSAASHVTRAGIGRPAPTRNGHPHPTTTNRRAPPAPDNVTVAPQPCPS